MHPDKARAARRSRRPSGSTRWARRSTTVPPALANPGDPAAAGKHRQQYRRRAQTGPGRRAGTTTGVESAESAGAQRFRRRRPRIGELLSQPPPAVLGGLSLTETTAAAVDLVPAPRGLPPTTPTARCATRRGCPADRSDRSRSRMENCRSESLGCGCWFEKACSGCPLVSRASPASSVTSTAPSHCQRIGTRCGTRFPSAASVAGSSPLCSRRWWCREPGCGRSKCRHR